MPKCVCSIVAQLCRDSRSPCRAEQIEEEESPGFSVGTADVMAGNSGKSREGNHNSSRDSSALIIPETLAISRGTLLALLLGFFALITATEMQMHSDMQMKRIS